MVNVNDISITSLDVITAFSMAGVPRFILDELQDTKIAHTQEKQDITGKGGRKLNSLKKNKAVVVSGTNGLLSAGLLETQVGTAFERKTSTPVAWTDYITVNANAAETSFVAVGTAGAEIEHLYIKNSDGTLGEELTQDATASEGKFAYDPATKKLTFAEGAIENGTEIVAFYMLSLDDSRAARAEEAELMAELAELQKELAESQESHALDKQTEALDELADAYEESRQPEIEALENSISSAEKLYRLAIERISSGWDTLYQDLIDWNYEAGNSLNSEITDRWNAATEAVKEYGSYLEALNVLQEKTGSVTNYGEQSFVVADVNKLPRYHSGGVVGDASSINEEEVVAVLEKNEIVIDDGKKSVLYKIIDFQQALSEKLGRAIGSLGAPNAAFAFAGAGTAAIDPIQTSVNTTIHFNPQISVGINAEGGLKQSDAMKFGERIAQTTLDKLHEAFERKGIGSLRGSLLRQ